MGSNCMNCKLLPTLRQIRPRAHNYHNNEFCPTCKDTAYAPAVLQCPGRIGSQLNTNATLQCVLFLSWCEIEAADPTWHVINARWRKTLSPRFCVSIKLFSTASSSRIVSAITPTTRTTPHKQQIRRVLTACRSDGEEDKQTRPVIWSPAKTPPAHDARIYKYLWVNRSSHSLNHARRGNKKKRTNAREDGKFDDDFSCFGHTSELSLLVAANGVFIW